MARVNSYMSGKGGARKSDAAIYARYNKKMSITYGGRDLCGLQQAQADS